MKLSMKSTLVASLLFSFALAASAATPPPATDASSPSTVRVTTGVTTPTLEQSAVVRIKGNKYLDSIPSPTTMLLHLYLNATGTAARIQVVRAISPTVDAEVIRAVSQLRWKPARLDNRAVPYELNLHIQVRH